MTVFYSQQLFKAIRDKILHQILSSRELDRSNKKSEPAMKLSVIFLIIIGIALLPSPTIAAPTPSPSFPYTVLPPIGKGHRKIGKLSLLKNKGELKLCGLKE